MQVNDILTRNISHNPIFKKFILEAKYFTSSTWSTSVSISYTSSFRSSIFAILKNKKIHISYNNIFYIL